MRNENSPYHHQAASQYRRSGVNKYLSVVHGNMPKIIVGILIVLVVLLAAGYVHTRNQLTQVSNPGKAAQTEVDKIVSQVSNTISLPTNEKPVLLTVKDSDKLQGILYQNAQNGDKLLVYQKSKEVLLFRPSTNKVIQFQAVSIGQ
jgi:hypothetical protein